MCPPQPISPAVLDSWRPASSVWAPGCDCLRLHSRVPTAHVRVALLFMNGPVVFWDLSRVPEDYGEGRRESTFCFRLPRWSDRNWELVPVKFGYPPPKGASP
ncbi:unnamed protein product [Staurois parvus]|uniref:Uncharacterized protein n=1 Tax=Staurois parvus TaxID=386267 RepID=A0ABN9EP93_9NEOB|nr:unnamed protein product [Staurois parvus]